MFIIASDVGEFERQKVVKFIRLKREIAKRLKKEVQLEPSICLKVIIELALEYEKEVGPCEETMIVFESKENEGVKASELVEQQVEEESSEEECQVKTLALKTIIEDLCIIQQSEELPSSFGNALGKKTDM